MNSMPKIVENQCGLIESTQSIAIKVMLNAQKIRPGAETLAILPCQRVPPSRSSLAEYRLSSQPIRFHIPRYTTARIRKNGIFRYVVLCFRIGSALTIFGCAHWYRFGIPRATG